MGLKIGVTGGIGSGKTTVCKIFAVLGIPVYYADEQAKALMELDAGLVQDIKAVFGNEAYDASGKLDRAYLAGRVFNNAAELQKLNSLVHPVVIRSGHEWANRQTAPYTLKEAALLFESGSYKQHDFNILVFAPEEERISRVMLRDQVTRAQVQARISKQMPESEKEVLADFQIDNSANTPLIPQVLRLHAHFLALASQSDVKDK